MLIKPTKIKREVSPLLIVIGILLALFSLALILPLLWALMTTFKSVQDFTVAKNIFGLPKWSLSKNEIKFGNYILVLKNFKFNVRGNYFIGFNLDKAVGLNFDVGFGEVIFNTLIYAVGGALVAAIVPCVVGYLCAKYKFRFSKAVYVITVFVMVIPIVGATPARIILLRRLSMYDTLWGTLIEKLSFTNMYFLVFYAFFCGIPDSFAEAAEVDGASQLRILLSIMMPMAVKMVATVSLILFVQYWNDYNTPYMFMPTHPTLSFAVFKTVVLNQIVSDDPVILQTLRRDPAKLTSCMVLALPIVVLFVAFKNKLMGNISLGGVKG